MATSFGGYAGELCQNSGVYRSECGDHRILMEAGRHFPDDNGYWSKVGDLPSEQELAGERARQQFWRAFA